MDQGTVREFVARVNRGELGPDVQIRYRVVGGIPSQRLQSEVVVDSVNGAHVSRYDALVSDEGTRISVPPDELDVPDLFESVSRGLPSLTPISERVARLPDSVVGRLTIIVDGLEEAFHVVPEREKRQPNQRVSPAMDRALDLLWDLATGATRERGSMDRA